MAQFREREIPQNIQLADCHFTEAQRVDLLLSASNFFELNK